MSKKQAKTFMRRALRFSFGFIVAYTLWTQIALVLGIEVNDTVTTCVFAFFGTEIVACMVKKIMRILYPKEDDDSYEDE